MYSKIFLLLLLSATLFFASCKKEFTVENEKVSGSMQFTQKSFTPTAFDNTGKPTKAKIVQDVSGSLSTIGQLTTTVSVDFDLVTNKSGEVITSYIDKDGDKINTTSSSVGSATGLTITETITGGTGKFSKITGSGVYFVKLDFATGNGTGTLEWTVTY